MGAPAVGAIILIPFPFSDLSGTKKRPALVLADTGRGDWVCAQITSNPYGDAAAVMLTEDDCVGGSLARTSYIRPGKLFTAHQSLFVRVVASVQADALAHVRHAVIALVQTGRSPAP
ncbi:MAG: type II toxin-antitoxin system PemK/MazF family toxin [Acidiferrobacter sp.]